MTDKKCVNTCPRQIFRKEDSSIDGECVTSCTGIRTEDSNYENDKRCLPSKCSAGFMQTANMPFDRVACQQCPDDYHFLEPNGRCVKECQSGEYYQYNSEILHTCTTECRGVHFISKEISEKTEQCRDSCPSSGDLQPGEAFYPFQSGNTCVEKCENYANGGECVNSCSSSDVLGTFYYVQTIGKASQDTCLDCCISAGQG